MKGPAATQLVWIKVCCKFTTLMPTVTTVQWLSALCRRTQYLSTTQASQYKPNPQTLISFTHVSPQRKSHSNSLRLNLLKVLKKNEKFFCGFRLTLLRLVAIYKQRLLQYINWKAVIEKCFVVKDYWNCVLLVEGDGGAGDALVAGPGTEQPGSTSTDGSREIIHGHPRRL